MVITVNLVGLFTMTDKFYKDSRSNLQTGIFIFVLNMDLFRMRTILVRSLFGLLFLLKKSLLLLRIHLLLQSIYVDCR